MHITIDFISVKNLSSLYYGERLLEILEESGLIIEKANDIEPINKIFEPNEFPKMWCKERIDNSFLFKGRKEVSFSGIASWCKNIHPNSKSFCGVSLFFNIKKNYDVNKLIKLGDNLFIWCDAVYGSITEDSKDPSYTDYEFTSERWIRELLWVNYFGKPYLNETDFHIPDDYTKVGNGVRVMIAESPYEDKLSDPDYLHMRKKEIGEGWFYQKMRTSPSRSPIFDRTEIILKDD